MLSICAKEKDVEPGVAGNVAPFRFVVFMLIESCGSFGVALPATCQHLIVRGTNFRFEPVSAAIRDCLTERDQFLLAQAAQRVDKDHCHWRSSGHPCIIARLGDLIAFVVQQDETVRFVHVTPQRPPKCFRKIRHN